MSTHTHEQPNKERLRDYANREGVHPAADAVKPNPAVIKKSRYKVWLRNLQPFVFSPQYRARNQRRGKFGGAFEINFVNSNAASSFLDALAPSPSEHAHTTATESDNAGDSGVD